MYGWVDQGLMTLEVVEAVAHVLKVLNGGK